MASVIALMRLSGYGAERDETAADLLAAVDYEAILANYLARYLASDKTDPEIDRSTESSTPKSSTKEVSGAVDQFGSGASQQGCADGRDPSQ
jgi:hypothetical protein